MFKDLNFSTSIFKANQQVLSTKTNEQTNQAYINNIFFKTKDSKSPPGLNVQPMSSTNFIVRFHDNEPRRELEHRADIQ